MTFLRGLLVLLLAQAAGETLVRAFGTALPGPVAGLGLLLAALAVPALGRRLAAGVSQAADALLAHLSLLFVPLGVGVVAHLGLLREQGLALGVVLIASTLAGLAVTAAVLKALWRDPDGDDGHDPVHAPLGDSIGSAGRS